ncbi:MAG: hypothetical protein QXR85_02590 [Candidatus Micrarchaeaceae archaeon]
MCFEFKNRELEISDVLRLPNFSNIPWRQVEGANVAEKQNKEEAKSLLRKSEQ